jgi:hypothetical protein
MIPDINGLANILIRLRESLIQWSIRLGKTCGGRGCFALDGGFRPPTFLGQALSSPSSDIAGFWIPAVSTAIQNFNDP